MFVLILTLTPDFLATTRALAAELPYVGINTCPVQALPFKAGTPAEDILHWLQTYTESGQYDKVELVWREG